MGYGWKKQGRLAPLLLLCLLLCLLVAALRGWRLSRASEEAMDLEGPSLTVYLHKEARTVEMDLDAYLYGVIGGEMPASFPLEALKAQAVAARTYTVRRMKALGGNPCGRGGADICTDSTCCQSYRTEAELADTWGDNAEAYQDKLLEAVSGTHGLIALYDGEPIEALYHSAAGGHTEDAQNVFSAALPYLVGVDSPGEEDAANYQQTRTFSREEFTEAVNGTYAKAKLSQSKLEEQVEVLSRYESGQVAQLQLGNVTISGRDLRKLLDLRSANFQIDISGEQVEITTQGYGHGVGLSQYGARAMALEGADFREILEHYYTGVTIAPLEEWEAEG